MKVLLLRSLNLLSILLLLFICKITVQEEQDNEYDPEIDPQSMNLDFKVNKTELEIALEECMIEYTECLSFVQMKPICVRHDNGSYSLFNTICDIDYENCRNTENNMKWHYIKDDKC
ncbi:uncharacterized protein LOC124539662 [Vanessa cardui]|uniref:uncharacterized protein LOC124539662 n=1 Tax=Vanessa cardui TaxID=171605 RepID=UPI001F141DBE|nr:uncharacterized protein LOC124539662 [Vanessa cardui]